MEARDIEPLRHAIRDAAASEAAARDLRHAARRDEDQRAFLRELRAVAEETAERAPERSSANEPDAKTNDAEKRVGAVRRRSNVDASDERRTGDEGNAAERTDAEETGSPGGGDADAAPAAAAKTKTNAKLPRAWADAGALVGRRSKLLELVEELESTERRARVASELVRGFRGRFAVWRRRDSMIGPRRPFRPWRVDSRGTGSRPLVGRARLRNP